MTSKRRRSDVDATSLRRVDISAMSRVAGVRPNAVVDKAAQPDLSLCFRLRGLECSSKCVLFENS